MTRSTLACNRPAISRNSTTRSGLNLGAVSSSVTQPSFARAILRASRAGGELRHKRPATYTSRVATVDRIKLAYNNVYVVRHAKDVVLIDTGPDYSGAREKLAKTAPSAPDLVVATHGHLDHAGLGAYWGSRGIPVAIGPADALLTEASALDRQDQFEDMIQFVRASGAPRRGRRRGRGRTHATPCLGSPGRDS